MGQQQLLLIILGVIIVGIAIAVGISQFGAQSTQANKDGITSSLVSIGANAYQFKVRPTTLGGGGNTYTGYVIPQKMQSNDNGRYTISTAGNATTIAFQGVSQLNASYTATCTLDSTGRTSLVYAGGW